VKFFEIIKPGTKIDFIGRWRLWIGISLAVIAAGVIGVLTLGIRWGIDFAGGTDAEVKFHAPVETRQIEDALAGLDLPGLTVVRFGEANNYLIRFKGERKIEVPGQPPNPVLTPQNDRITALQVALDERVGANDVERVEFVGPKAGAELRNAGLKALGVSFLLILAYVWFRFSASFAPGAVIALIHDVLVTCSIWVLLGREFDLTVLAALLALVGYSLNDTIIVYDRIRETMGVHGRADLAAVINESVNHTLSRTLITSGATMLSVLALLALGGSVVRNFALTMTIGIVVGTYSSIYIASPIALFLENRRAKPAAPTKPARPERKAHA
jgi:preprotein translocase subunit SecF